jgi:DNA-binding beta-propeller fold protein YncE
MRSTGSEHPSRGSWRRSWWPGAMLTACLAWTAPAHAQPYVYVTDHGANISQYDAIGGPLSALTPSEVANPHGPFAIAVSPDGKSVYTANNGDNTVSQYDVGANGALTPKNPVTLADGADPTGIAVSPRGNSVYVVDLDGTILRYDVGPGGVLTPTAASVDTGAGGVRLAVSPDGTSLYVTSGDSLGVFQYDVGAGGALTPKSPASVPAGADPIGVAVSPDGKSVYVANNSQFAPAGTVSQYDVGAGGALAPKTPASVAAGIGPESIVVSPDGKSVYVADQEEGDVFQFDVGGGGALTPKVPASVPTANALYGIAISPDGKNVYATDDFSSVFQFDVGAGGVLSPRTPASVPAGDSPTGIAVTPVPRAPTSKDQCKNGGWRNFPQFKNQGDCISFVETGK